MALADAEKALSLEPMCFTAEMQRRAARSNIIPAPRNGNSPPNEPEPNLPEN